MADFEKIRRKKGSYTPKKKTWHKKDQVLFQ